MKFESGKLYHVYNQGNDRQPIFFSRENYRFFMKKMAKHLSPHCHTLAWCLMPNHFHWMLLVKETAVTHQIARSDQMGKLPPLVNSIAVILRSYTQAINKQENRSGSLFRQKTKAVEIESLEYALTCLHYIDQNPIKAGFAETLEEWEFSSFREYLEEHSDSRLTETPKALEWLEMNRDAFLRDSLHARTADLSVK